jgi:hypothetical protein
MLKTAGLPCCSFRFLPQVNVLDNQLFALIIPLIQQGMNAILAANYNLLATESGNVITTEGGVEIEADTVVIPVLQAYQPTMQGANTAPALYIHKIGDQRIGSPRRKSKWTSSYSQLTTESGIGIETESGIGIGADGTNEPTMVHTEVQRYATMFQISALATQDPSTPMQLTASDIVNFAAAIVQSDAFIQAIEAQGVGVLKIFDIRNPYFTDDRGQFEASPSFDFALAHNQVIVSTVPILVSETLKIYPV